MSLNFRNDGIRKWIGPSRFGRRGPTPPDLANKLFYWMHGGEEEKHSFVAARNFSSIPERNRKRPIAPSPHSAAGAIFCYDFLFGMLHSVGTSSAASFANGFSFDRPPQPNIVGRRKSQTPPPLVQIGRSLARSKPLRNVCRLRQSEVALPPFFPLGRQISLPVVVLSCVHTYPQ